MFVHIWNASEPAVQAALGELFLRVRDSWQVQIDGDAYLYIDFYRDGPAEDEEWASRFSPFGGPPVVSVVADVSGRHDGWPQAQAFVVGLLNRFTGVATDDDWARVWQVEEVAADGLVDGKRFGSWRSHDASSAAG